MKTNTKKKCYDSNEWDEEEDHREEEVVMVRETKQKKVRSSFSQILIFFLYIFLHSNLYINPYIMFTKLK